MSRWIDYDAIDYRNDKLHDKSEEFLNGVIYMAQRIEEAQSIDIVRCKECKYYNVYLDEHGSWKRCDLTMVGAEADCFCSWGEREGE